MTITEDLKVATLTMALAVVSTSACAAGRPSGGRELPSGPSEGCLVELYSADSYAGVRVTDRGRRYVVHRVCFDGVEAVDAAVRDAYPDVDVTFADATHSLATVERVAHRIRSEDRQLWRDRGIVVVGASVVAGPRVVVAAQEVASGTSEAMRKYYDLPALDVQYGAIPIPPMRIDTSDWPSIPPADH